MKKSAGGLGLEGVLMDVVENLREGEIQLTVCRGSITISLRTSSDRHALLNRIGASFDAKGAAVYVGIASDILTANRRERMRLCSRNIGDTLLVWPEEPPCIGSRWRYVRGGDEPDILGMFTRGMSGDLEFIHLAQNTAVAFFKKDSFAEGFHFDRILERDEP